MQDLREEIRHAFERDQATQPASADMQRRVAQAVASPVRTNRAFQWMAAVATLLIAALVVAGLTLTRLGHNTVPARPQSTPSNLWTARPNPTGPPPAGGPLIYVRDAADPTKYFAIDWTGTPRGVITIAQPPQDLQRITQAPDGSAFLMAPVKGTAGEWYDRLGHPVAAADTALPFFAWSDDSKHLCALAETGTPTSGWAINLLAPDGTFVSSHAVALDPHIAQTGTIAIEFQSCSPTSDRAVLVYNWFGQPAQVYVVKISDGSILFHKTYDANTLADVTASPEGQLIAEDSSKSSGYIAGPTAPNTVIRKTTNGEVVANLDPSYGVLAFSSDDSIMLVNTTPWASGTATHLALIRLEDGQTLWRYEGDEEFATALAQPNGTSIAVMLQKTTDQSQHPLVDVTIVHADGTTTPVPGNNMRP